MLKPFEPMFFPFDKKNIAFMEFANAFAQASMNIGAFNEKMKQSNWHITYSVSHMLLLESLYSTRIEGTQTTIDAVYEAELEGSKKTKNQDLQEVLRYNEALKIASKQVETLPITNKMIKEIHKILLSGNIRKNSKFIAGEFRTQQNRVGEHVPPVASSVESLMGNLEKYINADYNFEDGIPALIKAALIHAQFETIHPFPDGNGRVGRVLIPIYLYKQNVISSPYFFLSQELEKNKIKYYSYLQGTRALNTEGFTNWIQFFLTSVINQTTRDIAFIDNLESLSKDVTASIKSKINTVNVDLVVKAIFKTPIFTVDTLHRETGINKNTLRNYINIMRKENILFKDQQTRNAKFYFFALLDMMQ